MKEENTLVKRLIKMMGANDLTLDTESKYQLPLEQLRQILEEQSDSDSEPKLTTLQSEDVQPGLSPMSSPLPVKNENLKTNHDKCKSFIPSLDFSKISQSKDHKTQVSPKNKQPKKHAPLIKKHFSSGNLKLDPEEKKSSQLNQSVINIESNEYDYSFYSIDSK